jgi:rhodanese-related sulfurtransferase
MKNRKTIKAILLMSMMLSLIISHAIYAQEVPRMTKEELKAMIDNPELVIVDVRSGRDWKSSESKIKNAIREEPRKADSWGDKYDKSKTLVLYCA